MAASRLYAVTQHKSSQRGCGLAMKMSMTGQRTDSNGRKRTAITCLCHDKFASSHCRPPPVRSVWLRICNKTDHEKVRSQQHVETHCTACISDERSTCSYVYSVPAAIPAQPVRQRTWDIADHGSNVCERLERSFRDSTAASSVTRHSEQSSVFLQMKRFYLASRMDLGNARDGL